ncbi:MAG: metal ABC transporter ATP-binding protein [Firmicutes bacterium]|nr:metal ABC transporter ATP-binding protein [Bacillota bacterium]
MVPALEVRNMTVSYHRRPVLRAVGFSAYPGEIVGIIGPNGAGKSTLFKAILGLLTPDTGWVAVYGEPVARRRRQIAYVPQREQVDWDYPATVLDVVLMGRYGHLGLLRRPGVRDLEIARAALERVGMAGFADRQIGQLSGGQQQRVFLARALAQEADLYFLDEPFVGVDAATEAIIYEVMASLRDQGKTILVVNHDLSVARERYDKLMLLNGRVVAFGPPEAVFTPAYLRATYGGRLALLEHAEEGTVAPA